MKRSLQTLRTGRLSRPSLSMVHRRKGLEIKGFIVSLSTRFAESTRDPAPRPLLSVMRRMNGGR